MKKSPQEFFEDSRLELHRVREAKQTLDTIIDAYERNAEAGIQYADGSDWTYQDSCDACKLANFAAKLREAFNELDSVTVQS